MAEEIPFAPAHSCGGGLTHHEYLLRKHTCTRTQLQSLINSADYQEWLRKQKRKSSQSLWKDVTLALAVTVIVALSTALLLVGSGSDFKVAEFSSDFSDVHPLRLQKPNDIEIASGLSEHQNRCEAESPLHTASHGFDELLRYKNQEQLDSHIAAWWSQHVDFVDGKPTIITQRSCVRPLDSYNAPGRLTGRVWTGLQPFNSLSVGLPLGVLGAAVCALLVVVGVLRRKNWRLAQDVTALAMVVQQYQTHGASQREMELEEALAELEQLLGERDDELMQLHEEYNQLCVVREFEIHAKDEQLNEGRAWLDRAQAQLMNTQAELSNKEIEIKALNNQLKEMSEATLGLKCHVNLLCKQHEAQVQMLNDQITTLQQVVHENKDDGRKLSRQNTLLTDVRQESAARLQQIETLQQVLQEQHEVNAKMENENQELATKLKEVKEALSTAEATACNYETAEMHLHATRLVLEQRDAQLDSLQQLVQQRAGQAGELTQMLEEQSMENEHLKQLLDQRASENRRLREVVEKQTAENERMGRLVEKQAIEVEELGQNLYAAEQEILKLKADLERACAERDAAVKSMTESEVGALREQLELYESTLTGRGVSSLQQEVQSLRSALKAKEQQAVEAKISLVEAYDSKVELREQVEFLQGELSARSFEVDTLRAELAQVQVGRESDLAAVQQTACKLQDHLTATLGDTAQAEAKLAAVQDDDHGLQGTLDSLAIHHHALQQELGTIAHIMQTATQALWQAKKQQRTACEVEEVMEGDAQTAGHASPSQEPVTTTASPELPGHPITTQLKQRLNKVSRENGMLNCQLLLLTYQHWAAVGELHQLQGDNAGLRERLACTSEQLDAVNQQLRSDAQPQEQQQHQETLEFVQLLQTEKRVLEDRMDALYNTGQQLISRLQHSEDTISSLKGAVQEFQVALRDKEAECHRLEEELVTATQHVETLKALIADAVDQEQADADRVAAMTAKSDAMREASERTLAALEAVRQAASSCSGHDTASDAENDRSVLGRLDCGELHTLQENDPNAANLLETAAPAK